MLKPTKNAAPSRAMATSKGSNRRNRIMVLPTSPPATQTHNKPPGSISSWKMTWTLPIHTTANATSPPTRHHHGRNWEDRCGFWKLRNGRTPCPRFYTARRLRYRIRWNEPAFGALRGQTGGVRPCPLTPRPSRSPANNCGALLLQTRSSRARAHEAPHRTSPH